MQPEPAKFKKHQAAGFWGLGEIEKQTLLYGAKEMGNTDYLLLLDKEIHFNRDEFIFQISWNKAEFQAEFVVILMKTNLKEPVHWNDPTFVCQNLHSWAYWKGMERIIKGQHSAVCLLQDRLNHGMTGIIPYKSGQLSVDNSFHPAVYHRRELS